MIAVTIYLDVLLLSNLWADYALLHAAARLTHTPLSNKRGLLAALLGACAACIILLPRLPPAAALAGRILPAFGICAAAFGLRPIRRLCRMTAVFLLLSMFFCGMLYALAMLRHASGFCMHNMVFYADISLFTLLTGTAAAAAAATFLNRRSEILQHRRYRLHLRIGSHDLLLPALCDTGNTLKDAFSGKPVIVCSALPELSQLLTQAGSAAAFRGFRMIPVKTVAGTKLLPAIQPDYAAILRTDDPQETPVDALVAVTDAIEAPAILPAVLVSGITFSQR